MPRQSNTFAQSLTVSVKNTFGEKVGIQELKGKINKKERKNEKRGKGYQIQC